MGNKAPTGGEMQKVSVPFLISRSSAIPRHHLLGTSTVTKVVREETDEDEDRFLATPYEGIVTLTLSNAAEYSLIAQSAVPFYAGAASSATSCQVENRSDRVWR